MRRPVLGSSVRLVLAAFTALFAVGIAFHGGIATGRVLSDPLVDIVGEEEIQKFAPVDMAVALDRVVGTSPTADAR